MLTFRNVLVGLMLLAGGCSVRQEPNLAALYAPVAAQPKPHPLIVIPGIMGSRLYRADGNHEVWPGSVWDLMTGNEFANLALPVPGSEEIPGAPRLPQLQTGGVFHEIAGRDFYGQIVRTLTNAGGYTCVPREKVTATHKNAIRSFEDLAKAATEEAEKVIKTKGKHVGGKQIRVA